MSDYCRHCRFDPKQRVGDDACPFTTLYWDFLMRNETALAGNRRLSMPYATLRRMSEADKSAIESQAKAVLRGLGES